MKREDRHEAWEMLYVLHLLEIITWDEMMELHRRMYGKQRYT